MDYANNAANSYGRGDAVSASLADMSIGERRRQENGVQMGHRGDAAMKGQTRHQKRVHVSDFLL